MTRGSRPKHLSGARWSRAWIVRCPGGVCTLGLGGLVIVGVAAAATRPTVPTAITAITAMLPQPPEGSTAGAPTTAAPTPNPHWSPDGCRSCHEAKDAALQPIEPAKVDRLCLGCHDGVRATAEAHPIGRPLTNPQMRVPAGWPTPGDRLSCLTCHDVQRHCRADAQRPTRNASFFRGTIGTTELSYCRQCHVESFHTRKSPHVMLDARGQPKADVCGRCHVDDMTTRINRPRSGTPHLRTDVVTLCGSCHQSHVDFFTPGHIGRRVPDQKTSRAIRMNNEGRSLPMENGRVVCSTCHNPHQRGLFPSGSALSLGAFDSTAIGPTVPLRIAGTRLCSACHGK